MSDPLQWYVLALEALDRGEWRRALDLAARVAARAPQHGGVHYIAGLAALQLHQLPLALAYLRRAAELEPARAEHLAQLSRALVMANQPHEALRTADAAMALADADHVSLDTLGVVYDRSGAHRQAAEAFRRAVESMPLHAGHRYNFATSCMFLGDIEAAEREYEACVANDPGYWRAHLSLAQLRTQTRERNHLARLESLLSAHAQDPDALLHLNLALAKEREDLGEPGPAFEHYVRGKAAYRNAAGYSSERDAAMFESLMRHFDGPMPGDAGSANREPIFIIGMPRSGTTLVDRIVSAHSQVHSAGELANFGSALQRISGRPARSLPELLSNLGPGFSQWARLGEDYVSSTRPGTGHTPHFTDKLPHNFLHAGFIARALPGAKIICLRRDPMDTCLSNFRQLFAAESPHHDYSYDLLDTGRYYLLFDRLVRHWQDVLPGRIMEVEYERLVESQEETTRALLDFCGLPWEETCLHFESGDAAVATASAVQVRSALNRSSMHRWKRYGAQLDGLRRLLQEGGIPVS